MHTVAVTVFTTTEIIWTAFLAAGVVTLVYGAIPTTRTPARLLTGGLGTLAAWLAWNFTLHVTRANGFNTDAPIVAISWADAGSGLLTFVIVALILGLIVDRHLSAHRVITMAGIAGITATFVDLFVL